MNKEYTAKTTTRSPRPRSKRLREMGIGSAAGATVVMSGAAGGSTSTGDGHTHANLSALNEISTDTDGYQYLTQLREVENPETGETTVERVTEKVKAGYADEAAHAKDADNADMWDNRQFDDYIDQPVRKTDSVQHKEVITDTLRGAGQFVDGLLGSGYRLWRDASGLIHLTLDKLTVRRTMVVLELLIERIRSAGGQIVVSAANGKIKTVEEVDGYYKITFEQENTFVPHDLMRCQTFTGGTLKSYWVEVAAAVDGNSVLVETSEFGTSLPAEGDEVVLMGNTEDRLRQNLILISATEDGQPRIDVMNGVKAKNFTGCLRARLGNLDGIEDPWFPEVNGVKTIKGDGLYCDNVYLKGMFKFSNGQDLATRFSITDGKIESSVEALREDFVEEKGFLSNPSFNRGLENWEIDDAAMLYETGQTCIIANSELLSSKESGAALMYDDSRRVMRIKNTSIIQRNGNMRSTPEIVSDTDGLKYPALIHFSVFVKVITAGTLTVGFENENTENFHPFLPFSQQKDLVQTTGYVQITMSGEWTGSGDFKFEFSGELYAYMFILTSDPVEAFSYRYKNLFEQSARLTKLAISVYDKDEELLKENGIVISPDTGSGIYARDADGNVAFIGIVDEKDGNKIKLTSDRIQLEGYTTINNHFIVHENGDIEATNATISGTVYASSGSFSGEINATSGNIGGISISNDHLGLGIDREGVSLYNNMIVFNEPNRQALLGTRQGMSGVSVMLRLTDTAEDTLPKSAIYFSVSNSSFANLAFSGTGDGVLNGIVEGVKFYRLSATTRNTIYHADISKGNHMIVACSADKCQIELPTLSEIKNALFLKGTSFAIRFLVYIESMYEAGGYIVVGGRRMTEGDSVEFLLTYDAENNVYSKYTIMKNISYTPPSVDN